MEFILGVTKTGLDIIDSEFNIRYIDPEWTKVYGAPTGKKCYEYFMSRREVCPRCGIPKALETKRINVTEEVLVKEDDRPIQVTTIPFQNNGEEWLVAEMKVDISERKAEYLSVHVRTIYRLAKNGKIPSRKVGGSWRFKKTALDEWLSGGENPTPLDQR